ncbi:MAG: TlpA family protein disulfide reductase [Actinobacteria bacterium]|nr:MAG: TlpA family protein disulfide reductase [Actinomycetota bacterium]
MNKRILAIVGGVVGLALIVLLAISIAGETEVDASIGYGDPVVTGQTLPVYNSAAAEDVAVGMPGPEVVGADWEDNEVTITADGRPKIVLFLAHWCPHCQNEVPPVQAWLDAGNLPDDVDLYSVATSTDRLRPNWPPQDWLEEEGWTVPVIMDDQIGTVAGSFGMAGTPFYVVLDGDNNVVRRISGEIGTAGLAILVQEAQAAG